MQLCRRRHQGEQQKCSFEDYQRLLNYEKERSERHDHFFALCGLVFTGFQGEELIGFLQNHLRTSDYVFQIPKPDEPLQISTKIGVLLPETDSAGAAVVIERLNQICNVWKVQAQMGLAIYPDDATVPEQLLKKAFNTVVPWGELKLEPLFDARWRENKHRQASYLVSKGGLSQTMKNRGGRGSPTNKRGGDQMINFVEKMKALVMDEEGAAAVEYGVLVAGIILVSILLIYSIGTKTGAGFNAVDANMQTPPTPLPAN